MVNPSLLNGVADEMRAVVPAWMRRCDQAWRDVVRHDSRSNGHAGDDVPRHVQSYARVRAYGQAQCGANEVIGHASCSLVISARVRDRCPCRCVRHDRHSRRRGCTATGVRSSDDFSSPCQFCPDAAAREVSARRSIVRCANAMACKYFHWGSRAEPGTEIAPHRNETLHDTCPSCFGEALHPAISRSIVMRATPCTHSRTGLHWSR